MELSDDDHLMYLYLYYHTAMVEALVSKTRAWEKDNGIEFTYDGVRWNLCYLHKRAVTYSIVS